MIIGNLCQFKYVLSYNDVEMNRSRDCFWTDEQMEDDAHHNKMNQVCEQA